MKAGNSERQWEIERPERQVQEIQPEKPEDTPLRRMDIKRLVEDDEKKWWEQETPQAKF